MSDETSSQLPVCVYCGTARPADESTCPECGKPWIDVSVADAAGATAPLLSGKDASGPVPPPPIPGVDDTGEFDFDDWTLPPEQPKSKARWIIPILLLIAVVVVWGLVFIDRGPSTTNTIAAETTTTEGAVTTLPETTTTAVETTTSTTPETTTTTIPYPLPEDWPPSGDSIGLDELTLKASSIGPLEFGSPIGDVAGQLTMTAGEAQEAGIDGTCGPEEGYWLQFGALRALFDGWEDDSTFVSYRYEEVGTGPDLGLTTLSGLALGDTVADLKAIYGSSYTISFELIDSKDHFRLSDGGELLLWGPVSGTEDDGIIEGIYSPSPCDS